MRGVLKIVLVAAAIGGGWWFLQQYEVHGLKNLRLTKRDGSTTGFPWQAPAATWTAETDVPVERASDTIRIATFNLQVYGRTKADKPHVVDLLSRVLRQFDVIAVQEIRALDQDVLPRLVDQINAAGRQYDYVIGPRLGRTDNKEQYAFIFDRASVEIDRFQLYTVDDPDDLLHREPLVGWFRVRGPAAQEAFTFTLVNIHTDPDEVRQELDVLDDVFRFVLGDGRQEDDLIMLGDFNADDRHLGQLGLVSELMPAILALPTTTRGTEQYDNILFSGLATTEFTGRAGVLDFLREYNLTMEQALEISDHLPVWAEFTVYEGGQPGRVAAQPLVSGSR
ncbi:MAG: endonuclease/exonuclease/phosphatase family protein [Planctomycetales bacterium]|nr:endonuclease/exonuclease/phosphatase family protein [Planctomycetales bacterium]